MSGPKHSLTILPFGVYDAAADEMQQQFGVSCLCGWKASQGYRLHGRAVRAYHRHLETAR